MSPENRRTREREESLKNNKRNRRRKRKKQTATAFVIVLFISILTVAVLSLTVFFKVENVNVSGSKMYTAEEIVSAAEITTADNLFVTSATGNRISKKLQRALPFINNVKFKISLPSSLSIIVEETVEEICFSNNNGNYTADFTGKVIKKYDEIPQEQLLITVSEGTKLNEGDKVSFLSEREEELFNKFSSFIKENDFEINFINISDPYSAYLKIEDRIVVKFGSATYFDNKISYLKAALSGISKNAKGVFDLSGWTPENNQPVLTHEDVSKYLK